MVDIWTARISYRGKDALNVTRKANDPVGMAFAPSWDLLRPFLRLRRDGQLTDAHWSRYKALYMGEMHGSYVQHRAIWCRVLSREVVTLCCYCTRPERCHRTVLAMLLGTLGARVCGERPKAADKAVGNLRGVT